MRSVRDLKFKEASGFGGCGSLVVDVVPLMGEGPIQTHGGFVGLERCSLRVPER